MDESEKNLDRTRFVIRYSYAARGRTYESPQVWNGSSDGCFVLARGGLR